MRPFRKYEKLGAYHWDWYEQNKFNYRKHVDTVVSYFKGRKGTLLDIGCGDALITNKLAELGLKVTGIDLNETAIELGIFKCAEAIKKGELSLFPISIFSINKSRSYDYILCNEVIEHILEPYRCVKRIGLMTKRFAIITTPNLKYHSIGEYDNMMWDNKTIHSLFEGCVGSIKFLKKGSNFHVKLIR